MSPTSRGLQTTTKDWAQSEILLGVLVGTLALNTVRVRRLMWARRGWEGWCKSIVEFYK